MFECKIVHILKVCPTLVYASLFSEWSSDSLKLWHKRENFFRK